MDVLHCDICFGIIVQNQNLKFYCGQDLSCRDHIHCDKCVTDFCGVCKKRFNKVPINNNMASELLRKFMPLSDLATNVQSSVENLLENCISFEDHSVRNVLVPFNKRQTQLKTNREMKSQIQEIIQTENQRIVKLKKYITEVNTQISEISLYRILF